MVHILWKNSLRKMVVGVSIVAMAGFGLVQAQVPKGVDKPLKFAVIMEFGTGPIMTRCINGIKEEAGKTGVDVSFYDAQWDPVKMVDLANTAVTQNVDAILISHGKPEPLTPVLKKAVEKGIKVVAFDCDVSIPGVTTIDQGDQEMARLILEQMVKDIGGNGSIVKIWVPGFAPMEKRQITYAAVMKANPNLKEIAAFGVASNTTMLQTEEQMTAILKQNPAAGSIKAIWASWDEFAKGATKAINTAGRNEIKVYGIDVTDEDLQIMQAKGSPWVATAAVDTKYDGQVHFRIALQKCAGENLPPKVSLKPVLILRSALPENVITVDELQKYIPAWGDKGEFLKPWMNSMKKTK